MMWFLIILVLNLVKLAGAIPCAVILQIFAFSAEVKPVCFAINPISKNNCWKYQFLMGN